MTNVRNMRFVALPFATLLLILAFGVVSGVNGESADSNRKRILMLSSYHPAFPTYQQQVDGVRDTFAGRDVLIDFEFMDSKRFIEEKHRLQFLDMLSTKLSQLPPYDGVITADDNALSFALANREKLFPSVPITFFGVNNRKLALAQNRKSRVTGVVEAVSMEATLQMAMELFPHTSTIYAIVDRTPSGQGDLDTFYSYRSRFPLDELSLENLSFNELEAKLQGLDKNSVVLLISAYHDRTGRTLTFDESLSLITENSSVPIFHLWHHGMGKGVLGGKLNSQYRQALAASSIMEKILFSEASVDEFSVVEESPNIYMADYVQMKKYGLQEQDLPPGTRIINRPESFYRENWAHIWTLTVVIFLEAALIMLLIFNIQRKKNMARRLRASEQRFRDLFEYAPVALLEEDFSGVKEYLDSQLIPGGQGLESFLRENPREVEKCAGLVRILDANQQALSLFGVARKAPLLTGLSERFSEKTLEVFTRELLSFYRGETTFTAPSQMKTHLQEPIWTNLHLVIAPPNEREWDRVYVGIENITQTVQFQNQLENTIREKDVLLGEIHHRVNNNLALISSFLHLQTMTTDNDTLTMFLHDSMTRIKAMSLVHEKLFHNSALEEIDLSEYIHDLVHEIRQAYSSPSTKVECAISCEKLTPSIDFMIPLGLMINEIVSNSMKHAFNSVARPRIGVRIEKIDNLQLKLHIEDNGIGMQPKAPPASRQKGSMGLLIIDTLIEQLQGSKQLVTDQGTHYTIILPTEESLNEQHNTYSRR
ncbi:MAG: sensor histidine kinase [Spirochaetia bacterium]|nr:sensor histidine kinase [Spirochaetia bacterium]